MTEFRLFNLNSLYPTPAKRLENPVSTPLSVGDIVRAKVGPASGNIGIVVVDRNGNYEDYEPYCDEESIGVVFSEKPDLVGELEAFVKAITKDPHPTQTVVRWFDSTDQLEVLAKVDEN